MITTKEQDIAAGRIISAEIKRREAYAKGKPTACEQCGARYSPLTLYGGELHGYDMAQLYVAPRQNGYQILCGSCITKGQFELF
jgi:hypothetical protein